MGVKAFLAMRSDPTRCITVKKARLADERQASFFQSRGWNVFIRGICVEPHRNASTAFGVHFDVVATACKVATFTQESIAAFLFAPAVGLRLTICGIYGAVTESDLLFKTLYGSLGGGGAFLLSYSATLWRRAAQP